MKLPRRTLSLSANWRQDSLGLHTENDEVELFLDKYVFPLEKKCQNETSSSEDDSGLHSLETTSAASSQTGQAAPLYRRAKVKNSRRLVTIVKISGESSPTFRTLSTSTRYPEKTLRVARSKTLPSYHKQKLLLTVNGCESNQIF